MLLHDESPEAVEAREKSFVLGTYARTPFHPRSGKGARLTDAEGHEYWDLLGGIAVNVLGHQHPRLMKTLKDESKSLLHVSNLYYHPAQGLLAERLVRASGLLALLLAQPTIKPAMRRIRRIRRQPCIGRAGSRSRND